MKSIILLTFFLVATGCSTSTRDKEIQRELEFIKGLERRTLEELEKHEESEGNGASVVLPILNKDDFHIYSEDPY